ncbi:ATP-binding cassette domain-containing protein [Actinomadura kijaniata]|uniref:ATP-binding cassette domain-containing protein n=1 Tax=Actinomadura kijaniata TaxID=46161 RepID=UPI000A767A75|nr:ATP-binding cassette domain-containing protein [Actinomadura kijaniata]
MEPTRDEPTTEPEVEPVVEAEDLGLRTRRGPVFAGVTLRAAPGELVAVTGPGGSGRTSLLLTVAGRMRPSSGTLRVCGIALPGGAARVRGRVAVARATGAAELEPDLRVRDHVRERALAAGSPAAAFDEAAGTVGLDVPGATVVAELAAADATRLALALALLEAPEALVLDDLDDGADLAAQRALWEAARSAADSGPVVLAAATEPSPAAGLADRLVALGGRG